MAHEVIFAPEAEEDLISLFDYIFLNASPDRAFAYVERIRSYCLALSAFPERGSRREDLRPGLRIIGFERRVTIAFHVTVTASQVVVDRVLLWWAERHGDLYRKLTPFIKLTPFMRTCAAMRQPP